MNLLTRILGRHKRQESHPVFGCLLLSTGKHGSYWEAEPLLRGDSISVFIEITGEGLPSEAQTLFHERLTADPDVVSPKRPHSSSPSMRSGLAGRFRTIGAQRSSLLACRFPSRGRNSIPGNYPLIA